MTRIQLACYCLIASAFLLGGLLVVQLGDVTAQRADAEMVIARDNFTLLTASTRDDEEALFLLDNVTGRLLIYRLNLPQNQLELAGGADVTQLFRGGATGGGRGR